MVRLNNYQQHKKQPYNDKFKVLSNKARRKEEEEKQLLTVSGRYRLRWSKLKYYERFFIKKKNFDNKRYFAFYTKKKNNIFLTVTGVKGNVISSQSAGYCKITTKKKKRSPDTLKAVSASIAKFIKSKNIKFIIKLFSIQTKVKIIRTIFDGFKKSGVTILQNVILRNKPHAFRLRRKKTRRI